MWDEFETTEMRQRCPNRKKLANMNIWTVQVTSMPEDHNMYNSSLSLSMPSASPSPPKLSSLATSRMLMNGLSYCIKQQLIKQFLFVVINLSVKLSHQQFSWCFWHHIVFTWRSCTTFAVFCLLTFAFTDRIHKRSFSWPWSCCYHCTCAAYPPSIPTTDW